MNEWREKMTILTAEQHAERIVRNEIDSNVTHLITRLMNDSNYHDELIDLYGQEDEDGNINEPLQFYTITHWLFQKLKEKGEIVCEFEELYIWGRCTYGQSITIDGVIEDIVQDIMKA